MKIVLILTAVLLIGSGAYLSLAHLKSPAVVVNPQNTAEATDTVVDTMCTSTACMEKTEAAPPADSIKSATTKKTNVPTDEEKSITKTVTETVQNIVKKPDAEPVITEGKKYTEFVNPSGFVNSEPFTLADYIGKKIIVLEFITYSCINCQRTFPYMKSWHEKYEKDGLLVVGIHTPEFSYERDKDNVVTAMKKEGITFPIVMDNDYQTWNAYANRFWPHRYVIDYSGNIVFDHIGEGAYAQTDEVIQQLLAGNKTEM